MTAGGVWRRARIVVVGAGFAGSSFIRSLPPGLRNSGETLLVDRAREYPFIPLVHEVAVGRIHPNSIRFPIESLCNNRCEFLNIGVTGVDPENRTLETPSGKIGYEYLILAAGSGAARPPENLSEHFQLFWTLEDALRLRSALNEAWQTVVAPGAQPEPGALTVAIVGGGATGVELAAEIAALFEYLEKRSSRRPAEKPRVVLLEATGRLLGWLDPYFHQVALDELGKLGVEVRLDTPVEEADAGGLRVGEDWLAAGTRVWATGIEVSPMIRELSGDQDPAGRVAVDAHLTLPGYPEIYVLGDSGLYEDLRYGVLPPTASVAVQQGPWAAQDVERRILGKARPPFSYFNRGYAVSLGPESAVADPLGVRLRGPAAQALYRSIFLYYLKRTRDRVLATSDWAMERTLGRVGFGTKQGEQRETPAGNATARTSR
ncbi:MAG: NAD(P)/FAD-dependent oxidoreductase [Rubrobacteraceae bacterium]